MPSAEADGGSQAGLGPGDGAAHGVEDVAGGFGEPPGDGVQLLVELVAAGHRPLVDGLHELDDVGPGGGDVGADLPGHLVELLADAVPAELLGELPSTDLRPLEGQDARPTAT